MIVKDDFEQLLQSSAPKPARSLGGGFTNEIVRRIDQADCGAGTRFAWSYFKIKRLSYFMPALIVVASVLMTGTVYAALQGWPNVSTWFSGETRESANSRVVKVDTTNCSSLSVPLAFQYTYHQNQNASRYFRIDRGSKLTNDDVVRMVQGYCELGRQTQFAQTTLFPEFDKLKSKKGANIFGLYASSTVENVSSNYIQVVAHVPSGDNVVKNIRFSFNAIDSDVLVYDIDRQIALKDIHVGDNVAIYYRAPNNATSQELSADHTNTDNKSVVAITKNPPSIVSALDYLKYNNNFVEVIPCSKSTSGYCTTEEFVQ